MFPPTGNQGHVLVGPLTGYQTGLMATCGTGQLSLCGLGRGVSAVLGTCEDKELGS